jgi:agmatine deiminase
MTLLLLSLSAALANPAPGSVRPPGHIYQVPWWEREAPALRPPEASSPPEAQPYQLGEFDPIEGVVMSSWPSDWADTWVGMIGALLERDIPVYVCDSPFGNTYPKNDLESAGLDPDEVNWLDCNLDSVWMRDYGPFYTITEDTELMMGDAAYYEYADKDDSFPEQAAEWWTESVYEVPLSMEGGNFYPNGEGLCVSTTTVFEWYRVSEEEATAIYQERLGCDTTLWLDPLIGEGTGHVDMYFTFVDANNAIVGSFDPEYDAPNATLLDAQAATLEAHGLTVHRVPMLPHDDINRDGWDDYHTVINGYFANTADEKVFLMPTFNTRYSGETAAAREAMEAAMPGVTIVDVPTDSLIAYGGAIHCVVKSIPLQAWPDPCGDPYDFNDDACVSADTGSADTGGPLKNAPRGEEPAGCGCSTGGSQAPWPLLLGLLLPWVRRRC